VQCEHDARKESLKAFCIFVFNEKLFIVEPQKGFSDVAQMDESAHLWRLLFAFICLMAFH